jgi:ATP-binding cassette subfamily B tetracycline resistance protein
MFRLSFFGSFARQRAALLTATSFAPIPLHPAVERQLKLSQTAMTEPPPEMHRPWGLFWYTLRGISDLVLEFTLWNVFSTLIVLGSVFLAREVFQAKIGVTEGLLLAGAFLTLKVGQATIEYFNSCRRLQLHRGIQVSLYRIINSKLVLVAPSVRTHFSKGQLKTLIGSDVESIEDFISAAIQQWIPILVSISVLLPTLYVVSGVVGLLALASALLLIPVAILGATFVERYQKRAQAEQDELTTVIGEWVKNIRLVRYLGWERAIESDIGERMQRFVMLGSLRHAVVILTFTLSFSWTMVPLLALFWISSLLETPLNLLEVFSSFWILDHLLTQINHIPYSLSLYGSASAGAKRVLELLAQPNLRDSFEPSPAIHSITTELPTALILKEAAVRFGDKSALDNVSVKIPLNERTAIVGSVGSGKSTLLEALLGELPLSAGAIVVEFDGNKEIPLWRPDAYQRLRALSAYSPQQPFLSNATMRNNIDLSTRASSEDIDGAISAAQLSEDLMNLPRGLDQEVGESGINLSGGQKQRVSLARAFISQRPFLFLDDPLSAVDPRTEALLMNAIIDHGRGMILVSHRLAELERCDRIIVLENGRIVEDGTPATLASDKGSHFSQFLRAVETHEH